MPRALSVCPPLVWTYSQWDGKHLFFGGDERYRKTLLIRLPFTTRAVVFPISRVGKLYDPADCSDENFERWRRAYLGAQGGQGEQR